MVAVKCAYPPCEKEADIYVPLPGSTRLWVCYGHRRWAERTDAERRRKEREKARARRDDKAAQESLFAQSASAITGETDTRRGREEGETVVGIPARKRGNWERVLDEKDAQRRRRRELADQQERERP